MCQVCEETSVLSSRRRSFLKFAGLGLAVSAMPAFAAENAPPKPQNVISPDAALERLMKGNARYVDNAPLPSDFASTRAALTTGQNPFASVLSCSDARITPEHCFDAERGDLFVARIAGNYLTTGLLASLEYGAAVLQSPLIMVLGHTNCGAISAAISAEVNNTDYPGHISIITSDLAPAVRAAMKKNPSNLALAVVRENVSMNVQALRDSTPILRKRVQEGQLKIVGGIYNLDTGTVEVMTA